MGISDFARRVVWGTTAVGVNHQLAKVIHELAGVIMGIDNQSRQLEEIVRLLKELTSQTSEHQEEFTTRQVRSNESLNEIVKAQLVMQRDMAEAIDQLVATLREMAVPDQRSGRMDAASLPDAPKQA